MPAAARGRRQRPSSAGVVRGRGIGAISTRRPVAGTAFLVGVRTDRLARTERGGEHRRRRYAFVDQGAGHGQRTLCRQFPVVGEAGIAVAHLAVVGEAADHQDLVARAQVAGQRRGQALQQIAALRLQLVGIEREQHVAADADATVDRVTRPAASGPASACSSACRCCASAWLRRISLVEAIGQLRLHRDHADQDQHEPPQQHRHQVGEAGPDRRTQAGVVGVGLQAHAASSAATARAAPSCCRSAMICRCASMLRSTTSRACAT